MKNVVKRLTSFPDVEKEFENQLGVIIEDVAFTTANTNVIITHNLNYDAKYYKNIKCNTYAQFKYIDSDNTTITLQCNTNDTTVTMQIF